MHPIASHLKGPALNGRTLGRSWVHCDHLPLHRFDAGSTQASHERSPSTHPI